MAANITTGGAHCAAISGKQFSHPEGAAEMLNVHIQKAFQIREDEIRANGKHFSLYFVKGGEHKSGARFRDLASLIEGAAKQNLSVHWLAQGEGSEVMLGALKELKKSHLSASIKVALAKQKLFFSNHTASIFELEKLIDDLGLSKDSTWYNSAPLDVFAGGLKNNLVAEIVLAGKKAAQGARDNNESVVAARTRSFTDKTLNSPLVKTSMAAVGIGALAGEFGEELMVAASSMGAGGVAGVVGAFAFAAAKKGPGMADAIKTLLALAEGRGRATWYENNQQFARDVRRSRAVA